MDWQRVVTIPSTLGMKVSVKSAIRMVGDGVSFHLIATKRITAAEGWGEVFTLR
jgi:uncharacterized membrane protein